jgi:hypothetical protein
MSGRAPAPLCMPSVRRPKAEPPNKPLLPTVRRASLRSARRPAADRPAVGPAEDGGSKGKKTSRPPAE